MSVSTRISALNSRQVVPTAPVWRFRVEQYHQMIGLQILTEDDPVELLEGWIVQKMPKNPPHRAATKLTFNALAARVPNGWYVDTQEPITLEDSEPEPDVVVVQGKTRDYLDCHPGAGDVALVVEISEATLERDRTLKQRIYARTGIPIYWIVNLMDQQLEVYTKPDSRSEVPVYKQRQDYGFADQVGINIGGIEARPLAVRELFP